jgi:glycosyltransferase involved in cell wall biosynthesis
MTMQISEQRPDLDEFSSMRPGTKRIQLDFHARAHSLYDNLTKYPPDGYVFVNGDGTLTTLVRMGSVSGIIPNIMMKSLNRIVPVPLLKAVLDSRKKLPPEIDLVYSSGHPILMDVPWVIDLEFVTHMCGYNRNVFKHYRKRIQRILESDNCKRIMPWTIAGERTVKSAFQSETIHDKTEYVHLAVPPKRFVKQANTDQIRLLFVGSQNFPYDFDMKGGKEVVRAFSILSKKYPKLELTIRSAVPQPMRNHLERIGNVRVIDKIVPWNVLEREFMDSDIFLFPGNHTPGLAILDAMSYELPVIATNVWANSEMVVDGKNGFLIRESENIKYVTEGYIPNWGSPEARRRIMTTTDNRVAEELSEKTAILIEDEGLRRRMGREGRNEVEIGEFSIDRRNKKLARIFDHATSD